MTVRRRSLNELPGLAERGGHVFALLLSTGVVQIGRAANPRAEVMARRATARSYGIAVTDWWVSQPQAEWVGSERKLAAICREAGGRSTGPGSFSGLDFAEIVRRASDIRATWTDGRRRSARNPDERMALAVRHRAEGLSLRQIGAQLLVSYVTVKRDLDRWETARHSLPPQILRLAQPAVTEPRYIERPGGCPGGPDVTDARNSQTPNVIPLRRPA